MNKTENTINKGLFNEICKYLKETTDGTIFGGHLFAVGGCCRDMLMGLNCHDIDLCLDLKDGGVKFAWWLKDKGYTIGSVVTYPLYGTSMFHLKKFPDVELEAVHTRKEWYKDSESRNPSTEFGTLYDDAIRRDLTINAIYYDITSGLYIDPTGRGMADMRDKIIRTTSDPDVVFNDDPLRMMRVCTRLAKLGSDWSIGDGIVESISRNAHRLSILSSERIRDEFNKILLADNASDGLMLMEDCGLIKVLFPEWYETIDCLGEESWIAMWMRMLWELNDVHPYCIKNDSKRELIMKLSLFIANIVKTRTDDSHDIDELWYGGVVSEMMDIATSIITRLKYPNDVANGVKRFIKNMYRMRLFGRDWERCNRSVYQKVLRKLIYDLKERERLYDFVGFAYFLDGKYDKDKLMKMGKAIDGILSEDDMFNYKLPINGNDIKVLTGLEGQVIGDILEYCMYLGFKDPRMSREQFINEITNKFGRCKNCQ